VFPPGPGSGAAIPITSATTIVAAITRVTVPDDGKPVVELYLRDENNFSLRGLPAANIRFVLARLEPAVNGASSTWHAITRRTEAFPGTPAPTPADRVTGTGPKNQATTETATAGVWTDKQNGVYTYTFAKSLKNDAGIPYDGSLPHRVGLEIRLTPAIPANNAVYTFTPATNLPVNESGREIVDNDTCNACLRNVSRVVLVRRAVRQHHRPESDDPQDSLG
jgi:OmcA/MtrC family decaheme c-type cytochrome